MKTKETVPQDTEVQRMSRVAARATRLRFDALLSAAGMVVAPGIDAVEPSRSNALTAHDVLQLWSPRLKNNTDFGQMGGSPEQVPNVAAYSFRVVGPTFEELWNHYAVLCGMKKRYEEKRFLVDAGTGPNGSYIVSERAPANGKGGRGLSVFLLKTGHYAVTVTLQPNFDDRSISGSLTVVLP